MVTAVAVIPSGSPTITIAGERLGRGGQVVWRAADGQTQILAVAQWSPAQVVAQLPDGSAGGAVQIKRTLFASDFTPVVVQPNPAIVKAYGGWVTTGDSYFYQPAVEPRDIRLEAAGNQLLVIGNGYSVDGGLFPDSGLLITDSRISWSAFRDDNGNGEWDAGEVALAGVQVSVNGQTAVSTPDGTGETISLPDGAHLLTITPPDGYAVVGPATRMVYVNGADLVLPPIGLRLRGVLAGSVFADNDGDGRQGVGGNERGVGGVTVQISGPVNRTAVSDLTGRFLLPDLPDGQYTVSLTAPDGYLAPPPQSVTLADGVVVSLPLRPTGLAVGVVYEDWDGDGRRAADEPLFTAPITLTLGGNSETTLMAGQFFFWEAPAGTHPVVGFGDGIAPGSVTVGPNSGGSLALAAVGSGTVRGSVWHDANNDGIRQPWETPLAGVPVTLNGETVMTDENGRFLFINIAPGSYGVTAVLPDGLSANIGPVVVMAGRGAAVGVAASGGEGFRLFLPVIMKP